MTRQFDRKSVTARREIACERVERRSAWGVMRDPSEYVAVNMSAAGESCVPPLCDLCVLCGFGVVWGLAISLVRDTLKANFR